MLPYIATIQTYATSANLGPLFDRAGAKLDGLYMVTTGELMTTPGLSIKSNGKYPVPTDETNLVYKIAYGIPGPHGEHINGIFQDYGIKDGLALTIINNIKPGGFGISAAGAVAFVELTNYLHQLGLTTEQKIKYALLGEPQQHPDNVVPCAIGGIVLSTKLKGEDFPRYSKLKPRTDLAYAVVIPLDIHKTGGTKKAREALNALRLTNSELVYASGLAKLMIAGIIEGDFQKIWESVSDYTKWEKSVTYVRNLPTEENPHGIYGIDVLQLNRGLEAIVGKKAILTPSGAGPAMLIIAIDPEVAQRAASETVKMYEKKGHQAEGKLVSIRDKSSIEDFV